MERLNIALTFSGGGYRAACFHLGVLSYLGHVNLGNRYLIDDLTALSTVSGGTITGLYYLMRKAQEKNVSTENVCSSLYQFMLTEDLVERGINEVRKGAKHGNVSLIKAMSNIYDTDLFGGTTAGILMDYIRENGHLHQYCANATDFTNGLPFRFQFTDKVTNGGSSYDYGIIGNGNNKIPRELAREIRLSDILACSSCFPGGFEPMMFPKDFTFVNNRKGMDLPEAGIMDGGIDDNQGIDAILLAEMQLERKYPTKEIPVLDMVVVSDVSTGKMEPYAPCELKIPSLLGNIKLKYLLKLPFIKTLVKQLVEKTILRNQLDNLLELNVHQAITLFINRADSLLQLTEGVFMKRIRDLTYKRLYADEKWSKHIVANTIYSPLKMEEKEIPCLNDKIMKNTQKACSFGTTLWFTEEDRRNGIPDSLIAAGQYTICLNLLRMISRLDKGALPDKFEVLLQCEEQLSSDWEKFKENPLFMTSFLKK